MIDSFNGKNRWLSNFWLVPIEWRGKLWPSVEHAYQAAKCSEDSEQEKIRLASSPGLAKKLGKSAKLIPDWDNQKLGVMEELLRIKFSNKQMRELLKLTGTQELVEGNYWGDTFWGVCKGKGENNLGKLLMKIRDE